MTSFQFIIMSKQSGLKLTQEFKSPCFAVLMKKKTSRIVVIKLYDRPLTFITGRKLGWNQHTQKEYYVRIECRFDLISDRVLIHNNIIKLYVHFKYHSDYEVQKIDCNLLTSITNLASWILVGICFFHFLKRSGVKPWDLKIITLMDSFWKIFFVRELNVSIK